jgi:hypothetical protein
MVLYDSRQLQKGWNQCHEVTVWDPSAGGREAVAAGVEVRGKDGDAWAGH